MMRTATIGWAFVAAQAGLLATVVALPGADHWPTPPWLELTAWVLLAAALVLGVAAASGLGRSLTPTPVPTDHGTLTTSGLYRWMRHPIYSAVLLAVWALTLRSGNLATAVAAIVTTGFFVLKARWEEARLRERYPTYTAYAAGTPRFVPHPRRP